MIKTGVRLQCLFNTSVICRNSHLNTHLQQVCYLLPLGVGASCSIADAQSLFLHWYRLHLQEDGNTEHDMHNAMKEFEKSVIELQRLGLFLLPQNSNNDVDGDDGLNEREKSKVIHRASTITVELDSIDIESSHGSEKKNSNENKDVVLFQLLHGVIIPLLYSQLVNSNSNITTGTSNRIRSSSSSTTSTSTISGEEVSVESCLALLEQMRGSSLSSFNGGNGNTCRFMGDVINEVFLTGVRERVLHPCGNGFFRLHRDIIHYSHQFKQQSKQQLKQEEKDYNNSYDAPTGLLSLQWWWWRCVAPFAKESLRRRVGPDSSCVIASDVWINSVQTRVRQLLQKQDNTLPPLLITKTKTQTEEKIMSFITAAARCWCYSPTMTSVPKWRLQLSDTARVQLAMQTLTSIKSCLARRPAGVQMNELSALVSWPTVATLLRKKSLLKALSRFPSFFVVVNIQDVHVVQQQLDPSRQGNVLIEEVAAWILEGGTGGGGGGESTSHTSCFLQDIDIIVRAVTFLRKRQLRQVPTTFTELHSVLVSPSSGSNGDAMLGVLHWYNVVDGISENNEISWDKHSKKVVQLSSREIQALRTMEMFRKRMCSTVQLYTEAIEPFLLKCYKVVVVETEKDKGVIMPLSFIERWLQTGRLSLKQSDVFDILRGCKPPIFLNEETGCICLGNNNTEKKETHNVSSSSSSSSISTVVSSFRKSVPPPPSPPPSLVTPRKDQLYTFDAQLLRVHNALQPDALLHFAETTLHAVFVLLLPHLSVPSGLRLQTLVRRIRWNTVVSTLGSISSFLQAFDGLFFDLFHNFSNDTEDMLVTAYRGPVGAWLLYARLIARLFPPERDIPLGLVAEGLAWNLRFAPRFGDLPSLLRRVGRHCRDGYLLGKMSNTSITDSVGDNNNNNDDDDDDIMIWDLLNKIRQEEQDLEGVKSIDSQKQFALIKPKLLLQYLQGTKWSEKYNNDNSNSVQIAEKAVRRFPLFFQWQREPTSGETLLRIAFNHSPVTAGLRAFVEEYVCPLLRQHRGIHIAELDNRLGWSRGYFDNHPAGVQAVNGITSCTSLFGVLRRYVEVIHPPLLILEQDTKGELRHETVVVHPNKEVYQCPEDMLLEVNGLEAIVTDKGSGNNNSDSVLLRPLGRPVSLFELLAEEKELQESDGVLNISRTEEWRVLLQCEGDAAIQWEKELTQNNGDILVWCGSE